MDGRYTSVQRRFRLKVVLIAAVGALFLACPRVSRGQPPPHPAAPSPQSASQQEAQRAAGKNLYDKYCKLCHGEDGVGYKADHANQLRNPLFLATASYELVGIAIDRGRPGTPMAAFGHDFGGPLKDAEIYALVEYLFSLNRTDVEKVV